MDWGIDITPKTQTYFVLNSAIILFLGTTIYETEIMNTVNRFKKTGAMNLADFTTHFILFLLEFCVKTLRSKRRNALRIQHHI